MFRVVLELVLLTRRNEEQYRPVWTLWISASSSWRLFRNGRALTGFFFAHQLQQQQQRQSRQWQVVPGCLHPQSSACLPRTVPALALGGRIGRLARAVRIFPLWVIDGQQYMVHGPGLNYRYMGLLWGRSRSGSFWRGHQNIGRRAYLASFSPHKTGRECRAKALRVSGVPTPLAALHLQPDVAVWPYYIGFGFANTCIILSLLKFCIRLPSGSDAPAPPRWNSHRSRQSPFIYSHTCRPSSPSNPG